jgi:hypothetical protein
MGLANLGGGTSVDATFKIGNAVTTGTYANTTTSQYKVAFAQQSTTTENYSADYRVTSTMVPVGIIQSVQDSTSAEMTVRIAGVTKAYANDSILAFTYVVAADQTAGDAEAGYVTYFTPTTDFTSSVASKRIIGLALEQAQKTGAAISILLTPGIGY